MIQILTSGKETVSDSLKENGKACPTIAMSLRFRLARLEGAKYANSERFSSCSLNGPSPATPVTSLIIRNSINRQFKRYSVDFESDKQQQVKIQNEYTKFTAKRSVRFPHGDVYTKLM